MRTTEPKDLPKLKDKEEDAREPELEDGMQLLNSQNKNEHRTAHQTQEVRLAFRSRSGSDCPIHRLPPSFVATTRTTELKNLPACSRCCCSSILLN